VTANVPSGIWKLGRLNHLAVAVPNLGTFGENIFVLNDKIEFDFR